MWRYKVIMENITLLSGLHALDICDKEFYPNFYMLLKIFCILPVPIYCNDGTIIFFFKKD
jgi:hypothetical protein